MPGNLARLCAGAMMLALLTAPSLACSEAPVQAPTNGPARDLSIDDLLSMESFGAVSIDPTGRWAVYERRGGYDAAPRFDMGHRSIWAVTDLFVIDLEAPNAKPARLLPVSERGGFVLGPWSPGGRRLVVYRLSGGRLEAGVVDLADRSVRWTGVTPDMPLTGDFIGWRDDERLVMTRREDDSLPWILRYDGASQAETAGAWAETAAGRSPARTIVDSSGGVASTPSPETALSVVEITASTGTTRSLLSGRVLDLAVSPNGRRLAVLEAGDGVPILSGPQRGNPILKRGQLRLIDLADEDQTVSPGLDVALHLLRWSPASDALLVWARIDGQTWTEGGLAQVDVSGSVTTFDQSGLLAMADGDDIDGLRGVRADWLGSGPILFARRAGGDRFDWYALKPKQLPRPLTASLTAPPSRLASDAPDSVLMFADDALWSAGLTGPLSRLSPANIRITDSASTDVMKPLRLQTNDTPRRSQAFGKVEEGGGLMIGEDGSVVEFEGPRIEGGSFIAATSLKSVIALVRDRGRETLVLNRAGYQHVLDEANRAFGQLAFSRSVAVPHRDRFGRETRSWLYLPVDRAAGDLKGMVVMVYPGSVNDGRYLDPRSLLFGLRPELIAAAGYAVLSPAIPLDESSGADAAAGYVRSVDLAVDAAHAAYPDLPVERAAVVGHSFGGTATLAIAGRSTRYRSYVAWSAATDLFGMWGEFHPVNRILPQENTSVQSQMGWVETGQGGAGGAPWEKIDAYAAASPYLSADTISAPVLLITGDRDFVPMSQSERLFTALHRQGKTTRLVTYWGEGHFNWSPADIRDLYAQILAWLDQTLTPLDKSVMPTLTDATSRREAIPLPPPRS